MNQVRSARPDLSMTLFLKCAAQYMAMGNPNRLAYFAVRSITNSTYTRKLIFI